jgi:parallel beta-helix repeat protein
VEGSTFTGIGGWGIHQYPTGGNNIFRYNKFYDSDGGGILLTNSGNQVYYNLIYNVGSGDTAGGVACYNTASDDNLIYNNTIYGSYDGITIDAGAERNLVKNNIVYANTNADITDGGTGTVLATNLTTDPSFVSAVGNNFRLAEGSAAIGAGTELGFTRDFEGAGIRRPVSIGAYTYPTGACYISAGGTATLGSGGSATVR